MTVDGLDLINLDSIILNQSADNFVIGARAVTDVQIAVVGHGGSGDHVIRVGVLHGHANLDPAILGAHETPSDAIIVQIVLGNLNGTADGNCLAIAVLHGVGAILRSDVDSGGQQIAGQHWVDYGDTVGIAGILPVGVQGVLTILAGIDAVIHTGHIQLGHQPAVEGLGIPAQELIAGTGGGNVADGLGGIKPHAVGGAVAGGDLRVGVVGVHIVLDGLILGRNDVGVNIIHIHIDFHLMAGILAVLQAAHDVQQLIGAGLADDGALQRAGAAEPRSARAVGIDHQRVMLILGKRQVVLGSKAVNLLIQLSQIRTQSSICLLLGDGMYVLIRILRLACGIEVVLLLTHSAVAGAELRTGHIIASILKTR